ncbi:unnamed protein product [Rotaria sp. Silwood1]|nr:unnamed protein product [Rotaria sp. Silwood1]CAF4679157.1 unnamed protein product [Rotaria sp. Silwood1]
MLNPHNVLKVLSNLTSDKLSCNSSSSISFDEEHVALNFYKCLEFILESTSHTFETETTLDHDEEFDNQDVENLLAFTSTHDHLDPLKDTDYELIHEHNLQNHFSLDYMKRVVDCYDEINPITVLNFGQFAALKFRDDLGDAGFGSVPIGISKVSDLWPLNVPIVGCVSTFETSEWSG